MAWPIMLTRAQSDRLIEALREYKESLSDKRPELLWSVGLVVSMYERNIAWDVEQVELVRTVLDSMFATYEPDWYDEHLERAYHKLFGEWPIEPPWFVKKHGLPRS